MPFTKVSNTVKNNSQQVTMTDTTQSTNKDTGTLVVEGGAGIEKRLSVGTAFLAPVWATSVAYIVGDIVRFDFGLYECKTAHTSGTLLTDWVTNNYWVQLNTPTKSVSGLILSNAADTANDITIGTGFAIDSTGMYKLELKSALTKQLDVLFTVPETNTGGRDTGSYTASSEYFVWLIRRDSDGLVSAIISLSKTSPSMPSGYTYKALLRGVRTNATPAIVNNQWLITDVVNDRSANLIVYDQKAKNTAADAYAAAAYRTRVITTVNINEIPGASLASNQVTLPAGEYLVTADAAVYPDAGAGTYYWNIDVYNFTATAQIVVGLTLGFNNSMVANYNKVVGKFTIAVASAIEIRSICTYNILGGKPGNLDVEKYLTAHFQKIG